MAKEKKEKRYVYVVDDYGIFEHAGEALQAAFDQAVAGAAERLEKGKGYSGEDVFGVYVERREVK